MRVLRPDLSLNKSKISASSSRSGKHKYDLTGAKLLSGLFNYRQMKSEQAHYLTCQDFQT
jgi:hypothetical protein